MVLRLPSRLLAGAVAVALLAVALTALATLAAPAGRDDLPPAVAVARLQPGPLAPDLRGTVRFHPAPGGTLVEVTVEGLPAYRPGDPPVGPHGFHVHEVGRCEVGDPGDPFLSAGGHWNPDQQPHGNHAGDFPVLFSHGGRAWMRFFTARFEPQAVVGKAVVVHENPDDYRSQPAGAAGRRLGCGVIEPARREGG